ncbi:MAG: BON domain-containing protein [Chromatiales bacterium]|nr:BON domain-containing protein [Chromatiales bacterium]
MRIRKLKITIGILVASLAATTLLQGCVAPVLVAGAAAGVAGVAIIGEQRPVEVALDDKNIESRAAQAINDDPALAKDVKVGVTSYYYVVLLTGQVPNEAARQRVLQHVSSIGKITNIHDHLEIAPPALFSQRSRDARTTARVKRALTAEDGMTSATYIKVVTEKDTAYLMGRVHREEAEQASAIVQNVEGVSMIVLVFEYLD